jgi:Protein of unknown function (DUF1471)
MIHNVENWVTLSRYFHSNFTAQITLREHSPPTKLIDNYTMAIRKRDKVMRRLTALLLVSLLSGCNALQGTPQPAPLVADHPQEIRRNQTEGLQRMGTISALVRGSPDDAEEAIKTQAVAAKADYYVVIMIDETIVTGQWYSQAILYRK